MTNRTVWILFLLAAPLCFLAVLGGADVNLPGNDEGYAPAQPIAFSHRLHAGELTIDCRYCHTGAEEGRHAGIPPLGLCMNCHKYVVAPISDVRFEEKQATAEEREPRPVYSSEIARIYAGLGMKPDGSPLGDGSAPGVTWTKVYDLPDFVYFDHSRHVNGGVDCSLCHGAVESMERVRQIGDLSMGFCVNCHREAGPEHWNENGETRATTDCAGCHY